jgi:hypothetical protein
MKLLALATGLCPVLALAAGPPPPTGAWQIAPEPALKTGMPGSWDDWSVATPSILKVGQKWWLLFEGAALDDAGVHKAFGTAEGTDKTHWTEHSQNPLFAPTLESGESCSGPCAAHWQEAFWLVYLVSGDPYGPHADDDKVPPVTARLARSTDRLNWDAVADAALPTLSNPDSDAMPCLYGDGNSLNLWWLSPAPDDGEARILSHSISRDGKVWSRPNAQPTSEFDSRKVCCARVYPSADFYILTYVAEEKPGKFSVVTKISRDARSWTRKGPPEFPLVSHAAHCAPWMLFEANGARLFYGEEQPDNTLVLRSAFCEKKNYDPRP